MLKYLSFNHLAPVTYINNGIMIRMKFIVRLINFRQRFGGVIRRQQRSFYNPFIADLSCLSDQRIESSLIWPNKVKQFIGANDRTKPGFKFIAVLYIHGPTQVASPEFINRAGIYYQDPFFQQGVFIYPGYGRYAFAQRFSSFFIYFDIVTKILWHKRLIGYQDIDKRTFIHQFQGIILAQLTANGAFQVRTDIF